MPSPTGHRSLEVGAVLGGVYELTRVIGRGGMGVVFEAQHLRLPKRVAIKVLDDDVAAADHDALARFRREAEIASRLGHPNIITVIDFGESPRGPSYIVLELIEGSSLADVLAGPLDRARVLRLARQIGSALAAAHQADVVHRDLKPANIMIEAPGTASERAVILDFGISKILGSHTVRTETQAVLGTPGYMAPEQARGDLDRIGPASDVFAFAAILFEMLEGKAAFGGQTAIEIAYKLVHAPRPTLSVAVPRRAEATLARALDADPDRRPTLEELLDELGSLDGPLDDGKSRTRDSRRRWPLLALAVFPMLAALTVAVAIWRPWAATTSTPDAGTSTIAMTSPDTGDSPSPDDAGPAADAGPADAAPADASAAGDVTSTERAEPAVRTQVVGSGKGKSAGPGGCDADGRDGVYKRCISFFGGRCRAYGPPCGSSGPRCLYDVSVHGYRECTRVIAGRCDRFVGRDCVPAGKTPCIRTNPRGDHRLCVRSKNGRCLELGASCSPPAF